MKARKKFGSAPKGKFVKSIERKLTSVRKRGIDKRKNPPKVLKGIVKKHRRYTPPKRFGESRISYTTLHMANKRSKRSAPVRRSRDKNEKSPQISSVRKKKISEVAKNAPKEGIKPSPRSKSLRKGKKEVERPIRQTRKANDVENRIQKTSKSRGTSRGKGHFESKAKKRMASLLQTKVKDKSLQKVVRENRKTRKSAKRARMATKTLPPIKESTKKETNRRRVSHVKAIKTTPSKSKSLERSRRKEVKIKTSGKSSSVSASKERPKKIAEMMRPKNVVARKTAHVPSKEVIHKAMKTPSKEVIHKAMKTPSEEVIHKAMKTPISKKEPPIKRAVKKRVQEKEEIVPSDSELRQSRSESRNIIERPEIKQEYSSSKEKPKLVKKPVQHHFTYNVETKGISEEISKIIKRIEEKKRLKMSPFVKISSTIEGKEKTYRAKKLSAKDYGFKLQKNPNIKVHHLVDLKDLNIKPILHYTDLLLAILEIAGNCEYYQIAYSNTSRMFWEDIVNYNDLKNIFADYKPETLRKYWLTLSLFDVEKVADLVFKNKKFLDEFPVKFLTIVTSVKDFFQGKITDLEEYLKSTQNEARKQEIFNHEIIDIKTGAVTKIKNIVTTTKSRKKYEPGWKRQFHGKNFKGIHLGEIYGENIDNQTDYQYLMKKIIEETHAKFELLNRFTDEQKKKLLAITEDDKFMFKIIDKVVEGLLKEFRQYSKEYVLKVLIGNSMNIFNTYKVLKFPETNQGLIFTQLDDEVIGKMKGTEEYSVLTKSKGQDRVLEREDFLFE